MLRVVSVSLGSSARDKTARATLLGESIELSRIGTDGSYRKALRIIGELDGQVDAIGLGGIDLHLRAGGRKYTIRDAARLAWQAKQTPVVDGGILKLLLEPRLVDQLASQERAEPSLRPNAGAGGTAPILGESAGINASPTNTFSPLTGARALLVSAVDRWGMAEALSRHAGEMIFGDLMFALGIPKPMRSLAEVRRFASLVAPIVTQLPFQLLYPTGSKQDGGKPPRFSEYFTWADWICGDFHYISANLPPRLDGKVVLTNTTTEADQQRLRERGLGWLVTTTPVIDGRSFGMNVLEGCLAALITRAGEPLTESNYEVYLNKLDLKPNILQLQ